jgi:hypothetical protein
MTGLETEELVSFGGTGEMPEGTVHRADVDAGTDVIDLGSMRAQLEAERRRKQGGG